MKKLMACVAAAVFTMTAGVASAERSGKELFDSKCMACHANGVAGAPKPGDKAAWDPRAAKGIDALVASAKAGKNAMPPMGTCMDCSDAELKGVIEYMLSK